MIDENKLLDYLESKRRQLLTRMDNADKSHNSFSREAIQEINVLSNRKIEIENIIAFVNRMKDE